MQNYICYEQKDNVEKFETQIDKLSGIDPKFGTNIDELNYSGQLGLDGTEWINGTSLSTVSPINTELACAEKCYEDINCNKYTWKSISKSCVLKNDDNILNQSATSGVYSGYITRKTIPGTTQPGTTQPGTTSPGTTPPGTTPPGTTQPGTTSPGTTSPGTTSPGTTQPGTTRPGTTSPGTTRPGTTPPGTTPPGTTLPGTTPPKTVKPVSEVKTIIPGLSNTIFYIILGVIGFVILLVIVMMSGGSRYDD